MTHESTRTAIVTGAGGSGIGRSIALTLARDGMNLIVNHRRADDGADELVAHIVEHGGQAIPVQADALTDDGCRELVESALKEFGGVDACVINAGADWYEEKPEDVDAARALESVVAEVATQFYLMPMVVPHMKKAGWGRFVAITGAKTDCHGLPPGPPLAYSYLVAKGARRFATLFAVDDLYPYGITFNTVAPGGGGGPVPPFSTLSSAVEAAKHGEAWGRCHVPSPQDVAEAVAYLCSEAGRFCTGSVIQLRTKSIEDTANKTDAGKPSGRDRASHEEAGLLPESK